MSSRTVNTEPQLVLSGCKDVAVGAFHYFAVKNDGTMWGSGLNTVGQLGDGKRRELPGDINPPSGFLYGSGYNPFPILAGLSDPGFQYKAPLPASVFYNVPDGRYYTDAVAWAVSESVTTGADGDKFNPNGICTRGQIIAFLHRAYAL